MSLSLWASWSGWEVQLLWVSINPLCLPCFWPYFLEECFLHWIRSKNSNNKIHNLQNSKCLYAKVFDSWSYRCWRRPKLQDKDQSSTVDRWLCSRIPTVCMPKCPRLTQNPSSLAAIKIQAENEVCQQLTAPPTPHKTKQQIIWESLWLHSWIKSYFSFDKDTELQSEVVVQISVKPSGQTYADVSSFLLYLSFCNLT